ncbi:hypothetical protein LTR62_004913 [Meristemomyces frigidus]|uniref:C2H2-type domain-containing protein n=1 Tax=Meristemomyces frigidus TaxID=1508187 RepID=A0AAN7TH66_9PEZI|nr:hypothetical protein LTR62_004913 [Meristemomyces frigidus]
MAKRGREPSISSPSDTASPAGGVEIPSHAPKYASLEPEEPRKPAMRCLLPPHKPLSFSTFEDYETHYNQAHSNRCEECHSNFPTAHILDLHIAENHDPITATKRDAGEKTYGCLVEACEKVCMDWKKRRSHLVDKHGFPRNYDFLIVDSGVDGKRSMLRPGIDAQGHRKSSRERRGSSGTERSGSTEVTNAGVDVQDVVVVEQRVITKSPAKVIKESPSPKKSDVDGLVESMSSLKMVPRSITFRKRKGRSGFAKS